jgi:hypothetical protein
MIKRIFKILLAALMFLPVVVSAQEVAKAPLATKGKILSLELATNEISLLKYKAEIELTYRNISKDPIIFLRRDPKMVESATADWEEDGGVSFEINSSRAFDQVLFDEIDEPVPPSNVTVTLPPGKEYKAHEQVYLYLTRSGPDDIHFERKTIRASLNLTLVPWPDIRVTSRSHSMEDLDSDEVLAFVKNRWEGSGRLAEGEVKVDPIAFELEIPSRKPQPSGLVLHGEFAKWDAPEIDGTFVRLVAHLNLTFVNTGTRPVLVLRPESTGYQGYVIGTKLKGSPIAGGADNELEDSSFFPSRDRSQIWFDRQAEMRSAASPEEHFWVIQPGASHSFSDEVWLSVYLKHCDGCFPPSLSWPELQNEIPKYRDLWLALRVLIWPSNLETEGDPDELAFGHEIQERWSKVGVLETGDFGIIESEPIPIRLPSSR